MCRGVNVCTELGTDPTKWNKQCPLPTPEWMDGQIDLFVSAVNLFAAGKKEECISELKKIRSDEMTEWFNEHGQMSGRHRKITFGKPIPKSIEENHRDAERSPRKVQDEVFHRDGYRCRYCGNRLISQKFLKLFIKATDSPVFQKGKTNLLTNGIVHIAWPVADHVIPWNQGGRTDLSNLVSSCGPCNYGKDGYTIEQLGIENPFDREPVLDDWKGLEDLFKKLKNNV